jgi:hypothetical protein
MPLVALSKVKKIKEKSHAKNRNFHATFITCQATFFIPSQPLNIMEQNQSEENQTDKTRIQKKRVYNKTLAMTAIPSRDAISAMLRNRKDKPRYQSSPVVW